MKLLRRKRNLALLAAAILVLGIWVFGWGGGPIHVLRVSPEEVDQIELYYTRVNHYPVSVTEPQDIQTVLDEVNALRYTGNQLRAPIDRIFSDAGVYPKILLESAEHSVIYRLGCEGFGVALFSPMLLYDNKAGSRALPDDCHLLNIVDALPSNQIDLVYARELEDTDYLSGMRNAIIQEFSFYTASIRKLEKSGHSKIR